MQVDFGVRVEGGVHESSVALERRSERLQGDHLMNIRMEHGTGAGEPAQQ